MRSFFRRSPQPNGIEMRRLGYFNILSGHMDDEDNLRNANILGEPYQMSIDCLTLVLSFLSGRDKVKAALICKTWKKIAYSPVLWPVLDLSSYSNTVHNLLLDHILNKDAFRFTELRVLRLEGCTALRSGCLRIIADNCPYLEVLLLTSCSKIDPKAVISAVSRFPNLEKLELFGVTEDYSYAEILRRRYP